MLLLLTLVLCGLGILQIYSATMGTVWKNDWWKQTLYVVVGLAIMSVVARIDYHALLEHVPVFYIVSLVTLVLVLVLGRQVFGSRRWVPLALAGFSLQVSEFVKLVIVLLSGSVLE